MRAIILFFSLFVMSYPVVSQSLVKLDSYSKNVYTPSSIYALSEDTILTVELENKHAVLSLHDFKSKRHIASRRAGRGPGELSQNGVKYFSMLGKDSLLIWDEGQRKGIIFDKHLNYLGDIVPQDHAISAAIILNDTTAVVRKIFRGTQIVEFCSVKGNRIGDKTYLKVNSKEYGTLRQIAKNPLLNQGPMVTANKSVYVGFDFSSKVLVLTSDFQTDTLSGPNLITFPDYENNSGFTAPDHSEYPKGTLDIAVDNQYLYQLFSGKKFNDSPFRQLKNALTGKLAEEVEKSDNTKTVYVFDRASNRYLRSFQLPVLSKNITIWDTYLYSLSYVDQMYRIIKFKLPS